MSGDESNLLRLSGPDQVGQAVAAARAFAASHALPPDTAARLAILVEELVFNLFDHGGLDVADVVAMGLGRADGATDLTLVDPGTAHDPRATVSDAPTPDRGGGAGLALVRAWAEIRDYRSADGVNRLALRIPDHPG